MSDAHMIFEWKLVATVLKDGMVELDVHHDLGEIDVSLHALEADD